MEPRKVRGGCFLCGSVVELAIVWDKHTQKYVARCHICEASNSIKRVTLEAPKFI